MQQVNVKQAMTEEEMVESKGKGFQVTALMRPQDISDTDSL